MESKNPAVLTAGILYVRKRLFFVQINSADFPQAFFRVQKGTIFQAAATGVSGFINGLKNDLVIIFTILQFVPARMSRTVKMSDAVQIFGNVGNNVSFHHLLMIDVVNHLSQGMPDFPDDFEPLYCRPEIVSGWFTNVFSGSIMIVTPEASKIGTAACKAATILSCCSFLGAPVSCPTWVISRLALL